MKKIWMVSGVIALLTPTLFYLIMLQVSNSKFDSVPTEIFKAILISQVATLIFVLLGYIYFSRVKIVSVIGLLGLAVVTGLTYILISRITQHPENIDGLEVIGVSATAGGLVLLAIVLLIPIFLRSTRQKLA